MLDWQHVGLLWELLEVAVVTTASGMVWPLVGGLVWLSVACVWTVGMMLGWEKSDAIADEGDACGCRDLLEGVV